MKYINNASIKSRFYSEPGEIIGEITAVQLKSRKKHEAGFLKALDHSGLTVLPCTRFLKA